MALIILLILLVAIVLGAGFILKQRWDLDSISHVPTEAVSRFFTMPGSGPSRVRRRFARAVRGQKIVMPSGAVQAAHLIAVVVSEDDLETMCPNGDVDELARDTASLYMAHAGRSTWKVDESRPVRVFIESDPSRSAGWTPQARIINAPLLHSAGDSANRSSSADQLSMGYSGDRASDRGTGPSGDRASDHGGDRTTRFYDGSGQTTFYGPEETDAETSFAPMELREVGGNTNYPLTTSPLRVGRGAGTDLELTHSGVSREHAVLRFERGSWHLEDAGSSNGTWLNGNRLEEGKSTELTPGATLKFGPRSPMLRFQRPAGTTTG